MTEPAGSLPEHVEDEVLAVLDGDESGRPAALDALLQRHPEHTAAIRHWLGRAGVLDARPAAPDDDGARDGGPLPRRLGDYQLLEVLGRGGFGTVYRAEQHQPIRRAVAVKVINPGMDSREILARFTAEREALNRMDHPGIARLLDAGTTPRGRPFFVMELVCGPTLLQWCRQRDLGVRQRVALLLKVCDALQHAHQKAVLHRDLSASNVLIADPEAAPESAQPKIIDFGIAKSLADPLLHGGALTFQGTLMGTPEYMSPEQAAGRAADIDTRTDIYSLGVQLYELLTEQLPIPSVVLRAEGIARIAHVIATHTMAAPSQVAPRARRAKLRPDLDAITRKALARDREQRYGAVAEMAADLRRYLEDEPVRATAPTAWYRVRKFARRNRAATLAGAAVAVVLATTLVMLGLALERANEEARLREAANRQLQQKADAGFRLLANEERIAAAQAAATGLPPPWPDNLPRYDAWQQQHEARLRHERDKVAQRLRELQHEQTRQGGHLEDEVDRHLLGALQRVQASLDAFFAADGPAAKVAARRAFGVATFAAEHPERDAAWARAIASVRRSDGVAAHRDYRGLPLVRQPGLHPLGCHPRTRLWQFLDLRTHAANYPLPERDADGDLQLDAGTGVVFVLLPPGRFTPGARNDQPGMARYDAAAAPDECSDQHVALEAFLIATTELTVVQWTRLTGDQLPALDPGMPMRNVSWHRARRALRAFGMDLPTEVQWEYAARAGTSTPWWHGDDPAAAATLGFVDGQPGPIAQFAANAFGLYDVHGNVAEWCRDEKLPLQDFAARRGDGLRARVDTDPGAWRAVRGGSAGDGAAGCRVTARRAAQPDARDAAIGVRAVRPLSR